MLRFDSLMAALFFTVFSAGLINNAHAEERALHQIQTDDVEIPANGYLVEEIGDRLFWFSDGFQQSFFMTTGEGVIVVDAPPSMIDKYLDAIAQTTREPITHVIYSHAHTDHIGAADRMPQDAIRIAHQLTHESLARANDPRRPLPTQTFVDRMVLTIGNQVLELSYEGPNHLSGNVILYAPRQKVLSLMDFLFTGSSPFPYLGHAEDIPGLMRHHDILLGYDFDVFVSGHIARAATRADIELQRQYLHDLRDHTDAVLAETSVFDTFQRLGPETAMMSAMSMWLDEMAEEVSNRMLETWAGRMPGIETTTRYNAVPMIQSRRVD
ncbi:MBL fold metallo-hydrolase [Aestuariivita sp.]|uniref:MBL fold metallo-hydrolase n=1 Tax=Aestuariivita sp. TaxID=1872407 RepID=UPI00217100F1|nr:MBL fold metallo-hydrolase [Aestuariivita sp.]MCE8009665.1 MBL fold metallo-hydrolase [Aestuariivita sp.]